MARRSRVVARSTDERARLGAILVAFLRFLRQAYREDRSAMQHKQRGGSS
jgi:hypothetical protein